MYNVFTKVIEIELQKEGRTDGRKGEMEGGKKGRRDWQEKMKYMNSTTSMKEIKSVISLPRRKLQAQVLSVIPWNL